MMTDQELGKLFRELCDREDAETPAVDRDRDLAALRTLEAGNPLDSVEIYISTIINNPGATNVH